MKDKTLLTVIVVGVVIFIAAIAYFLFVQGDAENGTAVFTPTISPQVTSVTSPSATPGSDIPEDWQTYQSEEMNISLSHPRDVEVNDADEGFTLIKWGPTQEENTEFYDGISLTFMAGDLNTNNLRRVVEEEREEFVNEPVVEQVSSISQTEVGDYPGYQFSVTSLGERTYIFISIIDGEYIRITNATQDPENQGFQETVDEIYSTIKPL